MSGVCLISLSDKASMEAAMAYAENQAQYETKGLSDTIQADLIAGKRVKFRTVVYGEEWTDVAHYELLKWIEHEFGTIGADGGNEVSIRGLKFITMASAADVSMPSEQCALARTNQRYAPRRSASPWRRTVSRLARWLRGNAASSSCAGWSRLPTCQVWTGRRRTRMRNLQTRPFSRMRWKVRCATTRRRLSNGRWRVSSRVCALTRRCSPASRRLARWMNCSGSTPGNLYRHRSPRRQRLPLETSPLRRAKPRLCLKHSRLSVQSWTWQTQLERLALALDSALRYDSTCNTTTALITHPCLTCRRVARLVLQHTHPLRPTFGDFR